MIVVDDGTARMLTERRAHFVRGTLDLCLLATLATSPGHAYELARRLDGSGLGTVSYGTVYPLLGRLARAGLVTAAHEPSPSGPPRKVYSVTDSGRESLDVWSQQWHELHSAAAHFLTDAHPGANDSARPEGSTAESAVTTW